MNITIRIDDETGREYLEKLKDLYNVKSMSAAIKRAVAINVKTHEYANNGELTLVDKRGETPREVILCLDL